MRNGNERNEKIGNEEMNIDLSTHVRKQVVCAQIDDLLSQATVEQLPGVVSQNVFQIIIQPLIIHLYKLFSYSLSLVTYQFSYMYM